MTTLLPVFEGPPPTDAAPSGGADAATPEERATFEALVEHAIAAVGGRTERDASGETGDGAEDDAEPPATDAAVPAPTTNAAVIVPLALVLVPAASAPDPRAATEPATNEAARPTVDAMPEVPTAGSTEPALTDTAVGDAPPVIATLPTTAPAATAEQPALPPPTPDAHAALDHPIDVEREGVIESPALPQRETHDVLTSADVEPTDITPDAATTTRAPVVVDPPTATSAAPPTGTAVADSSVATPDDATATAPSRPWEQVAHAVRSIGRASDGAHRIVVRLDPPELGSVDLEVRVIDGRLSVHATVDSAATRDVLARALPDLRNALESSGLSTSSLDVGTRSSQQGSADQQQGGTSTSTRASRAGTDAPLDSAVRAPAGETTAPNRLDLRL